MAVFGDRHLLLSIFVLLLVQNQGQHPATVTHLSRGHAPPIAGLHPEVHSCPPPDSKESEWNWDRSLLWKTFIALAQGIKDE